MQKKIEIDNICRCFYKYRFNVIMLPNRTILQVKNAIPVKL